VKVHAVGIVPEDLQASKQFRITQGDLRWLGMAMLHWHSQLLSLQWFSSLLFF
jgi:hypothetical protein